MLFRSDGRTTLTGEVLADVHKYIDRVRAQNLLLSEARIFETTIRRNIKLAEAPGFGKTIYEYDAMSNGAEDYWSLTAELMRVLSGDADADQPQHDEVAPSATATETPTQPQDTAPAEAPVTQTSTNAAGS